MHSIYDKLFHHTHSHESLIHLELELEENTIESFVDSQRNRFHHLINLQQTLVEHASLEPTSWWVTKTFSVKRYNALIQKQINIFRMLHSMDATVRKLIELIFDLFIYYLVNEN
jgi:hypothetical protein